MKANASFSIWAYLLSVGVMALEMYATGWRSPDVCLCIRTAPRPKDEASADNTVSRLGSYSARTGLFVRTCLTLLDDFCCGSPQIHAFSLTSSSLMGCVISARFGENLLSWFTMPRNRRTSPTLCGVEKRTMAETLFGSGRIPWPSMTCPRNKTEDWANLHFSEFSVMPRSLSHRRTFLSCSSCSSFVFPCTRISSMRHTVPGRPLRAFDIRRWKCSGADDIPNGNLRK